MALELIPTGIEGLDTVLGGGLPLGTALMVVGAPGSGKTILTLQMCFNWSRSRSAAGGKNQVGTKALYFSTLSEPHEKLIEHTQALGFFESNLLGRDIELISLQGAMEEGLDATVDLISREARKARAGLVVIDGFAAIQALRTNELDARRFVATLSSQLHVMRTTLVMTLEHHADESRFTGEFTSADGILALTTETIGMENRRRLEVRKLRGVHHLPGLHSYAISQEGVRVYPRLETMITGESQPLEAGAPAARLAMGQAELDRMMFGGLPEGSSTLLAGSPGVGKTLLSLSFLMEGLRRGEPCLFIGFNESPRQLLDKARRFQMDLGDAVASGLLALRVFPPVELDPDRISALLRDEVENRGIKRLVVDSIDQLERPTTRDHRAENYGAALHTYLRDHDVTALLLMTTHYSTSALLDTDPSPLAALCENNILLRYVVYTGSLYRVLSILKMRDSDHDRSLREFTVDDNTGVRILEASSSASGVLSGIQSQFGADLALGSDQSSPDVVAEGLSLGYNRSGFSEGTRSMQHDPDNMNTPDAPPGNEKAPGLNG